MPTGTSSVYFPLEMDSAYPIELDNSYFLVKLHEAQAFFEAGLLAKPSYLIFTSEIKSTFLPERTIKSLHHISALQKNTPCRMGLGFNLTDWLPARSADTLHLSINYAVIQDAPIKDFMDLVGKLGLNAMLSMARPDMAVAMKISEIAGRILSFSLKEGKSQEIFQLNLDLNLATLKSGYYVVLGSHKNEEWPDGINVDSWNPFFLADSNGHRLERHSYAVFQVLALKRKDEEMLRDEVWWELLQSGKQQVLDTVLTDDRELKKALNEWQLTLRQVRRLAARERSFLLNEIQDIIRNAQLEVQESLSMGIVPEAYGDKTFPEMWQDILSAKTEEELKVYAAEYKESLRLSKQLLSQYGIRYNI